MSARRQGPARAIFRRARQTGRTSSLLLAREFGKDPGALLSEIVHDALAERKRNGGSGESHGESFLDAAARIGAVGCVKDGPSDVSCDPKYLAGFGED